MSTSHRLSLMVLLTVFIAQSATADDATLAKLRQSAEAAQAAKSSAEDKLTAAKQHFQEVTSQLVQAKAAPTQAMRTITENEKLLKPRQEAVPKAEDVLKKAEAALQAAEKAVTDAGNDAQKKQAAEQQRNKQKAERDKAQEAFDKVKAELQATETALAAAKQAQEEAPEKIKHAEALVEQARQERDRLQAAYNAVAEDWLGHQTALEKALIEAGQLVSFAEKVAPIFHSRCVACHNARAAKGRLNMETFAALMKGGESGESIESGDPDASTLVFMIEDGSMPKDADPLTKDEIAVIRKWIATGATLDAGKSPEGALITVMPKRPQPAAPETYPATIPVTALAFSPDGRTLASSGYHEVLLWNAEDGSLLRRITNVAERVYDLEFSQDGQKLAVAAGTPGQIGEAKLFEVSSGNLLGDYGISPDSVFAIAFSPDGAVLATAGADRAIRTFQVGSGEEMLMIEDHADWVMDVAWSADGKQLASASRDKTAKVFDAANGDAVVTFNGHGDTVYAVNFLPDGKQVVSAGEDKQIRLWNVADGKQTKNVGGFGGAVLDLQLFADGHVYTASADKNTRLHQLPQGNNLKTFSGHTDWVYAVAAAPAVKKVAAGGYDGTIHVWDTEKGQPLVQFTAAPGLTKTTAAK